MVSSMEATGLEVWRAGVEGRLEGLEWFGGAFAPN